MQEAANLAKYINEIILALVSIITVLSGLGIFERIRTRKSFKELQMSIDKQQTNRIAENEKDLKDFKEDVTNAISSLSEKLKISNDFILEMKFFKEIRKDIKTTISNVILSYNGDMDNAIKGLLSEGGDAAYNFFKDLYAMPDLNYKQIKDMAIFKLRSLRSHSVGTQYITEEVSERIKKEAAYPAVNGLIFTLQQNRPTDNEEFKQMVIKFVETISSNSVKIYLDEKQKQKVA